MGTGGIKPCVATFGGEQFIMPYQKKQMTSFFSLFYAAVNCGSLLSVLITPILRSSVSCFGQESCYPLSFGVPAILMCLAVCKFIVIWQTNIAGNNFTLNSLIFRCLLMHIRFSFLTINKYLISYLQLYSSLGVFLVGIEWRNQRKI